MEFDRAADMAAIDEDLRIGRPAETARDHLAPFLRIVARLVFDEVHALGGKQLLGARAVAAIVARVDLDPSRQRPTPYACPSTQELAPCCVNKFQPTNKRAISGWNRSRNYMGTVRGAA